MDLFFIVIVAMLTENFVLAKFLGICPFLGVSKRISTSIGMSMAVLFVMLVASVITFAISKYLLVPLQIEYLQTIAFILVIASAVQLTEMAVQKLSPSLYQALGIYLPLITTNCAILGLTLFIALREYTFLESVIFGFGAGVGFTLALVIMAGIREELEFADVPEAFKGTAITLVIAGLLALAFMGFGGLIAS